MKTETRDYDVAIVAANIYDEMITVVAMSNYCVIIF